MYNIGEIKMPKINIDALIPRKYFEIFENKLNINLKASHIGIVMVIGKQMV